MKKYLLLALALMNSAAFAAVIPAGDSSLIGGRTNVLPNAKLRTLVGYTTTGGKVNSTLRLMGSASGYVVPASKTLKIVSFHCNNVGTADENVLISYSDTDVGTATATTFTNTVFMGGQAAGGEVFNFNAPGATTAFRSYVEFGLGTGFPVPTGKYPGMQTANLGTVSCIFNAIEE